MVVDIWLVFSWLLVLLVVDWLFIWLVVGVWLVFGWLVVGYLFRKWLVG